MNLSVYLWIFCEPVVKGSVFILKSGGKCLKTYDEFIILMWFNVVVELL